MLAAALWIAVACAEAPAVAPPGALPGSARIDEDPRCARPLAELSRAWREVQLSMNPGPARRALDGAWPAVEVACRGGTWHLVAARQLGRAPRFSLETGDGVRFSSTREALDAGLSAEPQHAELLAFVAWGSGVAPDLFPALPADACERLAQPSDSAAYVCGVQHLHTAQFAAAEQDFLTVQELNLFPDGFARLRAAQRAAGHPLSQIPANEEAIREHACQRFGATPEECAASRP